MPSSRFAALQMVSTPEVMSNLESADRLIAAAAAAGARLAALPENFYLIGRHEADKVKLREPEGEGPIQSFLAAAARRHRVWIVGGTAPISCADPGRIRSACLVFDDSGRRVARYDKMHLFRFEAGDERYDESRTLEGGESAVAVQSPFGRLALSVCYDVRFPELYQSSAISTPCSFPRPSPCPPAPLTGKRCCAPAPSRTRRTSLRRLKAGCMRAAAVLTGIP